MQRITLTPGEAQALYDKLDGIERILTDEQRHIEDPILSTEQVMRLLNVSRRKLQTMRDNMEIEYSAINAKFFYRMSSITKMLDQNLITTIN